MTIGAFTYIFHSIVPIRFYTRNQRQFINEMIEIQIPTELSMFPQKRSHDHSRQIALRSVRSPRELTPRSPTRESDSDQNHNLSATEARLWTHD